MNPDDDLYRDFILNQKQSRAPQRKIYTIKYFSLMLTSIMMEGTAKIKEKIFDQQDNYLTMISIILAFFISSFSQFIGYRRLFFLTYVSYSVLFVLTKLYGLFPSAWIYIYMLTSYRILLSQLLIQIYGVWPSKFARIYIEIIFFCEIVRQIILYINHNHENLQDTVSWILVGIMVVNILPILMSMNDFKSPETDSVFKDFGRLLSSIKIIIFNLLIASFLLSKPITEQFLVYIYQILHEDHTRKTMLITFHIPFFSVIILIRLLVNRNYKPSIMILISFILLVILLIIWYVYLEVEFKAFYLSTFICPYVIYLIIFYFQTIFTTPQYWQILLSIGIRNLDFVSSYPFQSQGFLLIVEQLLFQRNNQVSEYIFDHISIFFLSLIVLILALLFIFYQLLGFKEYLKNTNMVQVEEDRFQIEIV